MRFPARASLLAIPLVLAACIEATEPTAVDVPEASQNQVAEFGLAGLQAGTPGFIVIGGANGLPKNLADQVAAAGGQITGRLDEIGVAFAASSNPDFGSGLKGVQSVIPDVMMKMGPAREAPLLDASPAHAGSDETYWGYLWNMRAIDAPQAWDAGSRGAGVVVAVLDEGFDLDHPDLTYAPGAASFVCWQAPGFIVQLADPPFCESPEYGAGFNYGPGAFGPIADPFSHATHVSGTISARDNGLGVIGVAPDANVLPVKVLSEYLGGGYTSWIIQGIIYATQADADVINMSLGGVVDLSAVAPGSRDDVVRSSIVIYRRAVNYAYQNGTTVVVAAGNDGIDDDGNGHIWIRPAEFENAITVSATGPEGLAYDANADLDRIAHYTNYGSSLIDFAAPGGDFTLAPDPNYVRDMVLSTGSQNAYYFSAGTSMASPHAAGLAALIIAENGGPMNPAQVAAEMRRRAVDLGKPGKDDFYGQGRISTGH